MYRLHHQVRPARPRTRRAAALSVGLALAPALHAQAVDAPGAAASAPSTGNAPIKSLGVISVTGSQPTSLPTQIPATMEGITGDEIKEKINASDPEDALKYFPSLLVRKRYIGDYNHAVLSSRASGTGNSARSAVYVDGILLSNYLGNGIAGLNFPPRWNMVTPSEIERVDVMYGPFSAAYPGNSVGAVVAYTTRMPKAFEVHAKVGYSSQPFSIYGTDSTYNAWETSASVGSREGPWAWRFDFNHTDSHGQPLTFATRLVSNGVAGTAGTPVTGAVPGNNSANAPWYLIGSGTEYRTKQDHFKAKVALDITSTATLTYMLGLWQNTSTGRPVSYLRNASGQPVTSGAINIDGRAYTGTQALSGSDFAATNESLTHVMQGLTFKTHTQGTWDWEVAASAYDYRKDQKRQNAASNPWPLAVAGGPGTIADGSGTGWSNVAFKGTWRPTGIDGAHIVDFGLQRDDYDLQYGTSSIAGNWQADAGNALVSQVQGRTSLTSLYGQDAWHFAADWKTVLGLRAEHWEARSGSTSFSSNSTTSYPSRRENYLSPKAALSFQAAGDLVLKAAVGRAVRMPTVYELYGATSTTNSQYINDPNLKPERSITTELTVEKNLGDSLLRLTWFTEDTHDSLYSQTLLDTNANLNITRVQNVGRIKTEGLEAAYNGFDVLRKGLDLSGSVTYAQSIIKDNVGYVTTPGDTLGRWQPNIPRWRATMLASYRFDERWTASLGARYSGRQYRTLNNADVNGYAYMGVSKFFTTDVRVVYRVTKQWTASFGIDNLNNDQYWNFHPYPQRTYTAQLQFDL